MAVADATGTTTEFDAPRRRPAVDFDFDAGLASLLDPPARETEWQEISLGDDAPATPADEPRAPFFDQRAALSADDRASGWALDDWTVAEPPPAGERRTVAIRGQVDGLAGVPAVPAARVSGARPGADRRRPPRSAAERLAGRPDRVALWAFLLGLLLIAIAALGTPKANAATLDAGPPPQAPALVVTVDAGT